MTRLLAIVGPTASGKSAMAVEVAHVYAAAERVAVEIVSCDSMAVYRSLDIAADKPTTAQQGGIPHHLIDVADGHEDVTAVRYRDLARTAIDAIGARGAVPLLVGGSGLWFRAVVDDLEFAPTSPEVRARLEGEDAALLYERLRDADPAGAELIDPRNVRRVVRAVEILELTGRPPSELRRSWKKRGDSYDLDVCGLEWDRDELFDRAERRVQREIDAGLVEEVRAAMHAGASRTARQALGVKEIGEVVDGRLSLQEATELLVRNTKNFVRKQLSWFHADERVHWVNASRLGWDGARRAIVDRFRAR